MEHRQSLHRARREKSPGICRKGQKRGLQEKPISEGRMWLPAPKSQTDQRCGKKKKGGRKEMWQKTPHCQKNRYEAKYEKDRDKESESFVSARPVHTC